MFRVDIRNLVLVRNVFACLQKVIADLELVASGCSKSVTRSNQESQVKTKLRSSGSEADLILLDQSWRTDKMMNNLYTAINTRISGVQINM